MSIAIGTKAVGFGAGSGSQYSLNAGTTSATGSTFLVIEMALPTQVNNFTAATDNFSNTYTSLIKQNDVSNGIGFQVWQCVNGVGGASHTIGGHDGNAGFSATNVQFVEITGGATASLSDGITQANVTGPPFNASLSTANANDLILAFFVNSTNIGAATFSSATFTLVQNGSLTGVNQASALWSKSVTSTGTYDPAFGVATGTCSAGPIATFAFKELAAGASQGETLRSNTFQSMNRGFR